MIDGCTNPSAGKGGSWHGLCDELKPEPRSLIAPTITTTTLVHLAQTVEDAQAAVTASQAAHAQAVQRLRDALDRHPTPVTTPDKQGS